MAMAMAMATDRRSFAGKSAALCWRGGPGLSRSAPRLICALGRFGRGPYLIRQIGAAELTLPASAMYVPVHG
jgi:hypothetical protein